MKIKIFKLFSIIIIISILFTSCKNGEINMKEEFVQGFIADDSKSLANLLTRTYKLQELKDFFGEIPPNESSVYEMDDHEILTINNVNNKFPIECLRREGYSVYKVSEGGYYYVFWLKFIELKDPNQVIAPNQTLDDANVGYAAHISSLKNASDFDSIKEGINTAEDVSKIDPAFELFFLFSHGTYSYSLLEDGSIMSIFYENPNNLKSRKDLVVKRKAVVSKEEASHSYLSQILPKDLP